MGENAWKRNIVMLDTHDRKRKVIWACRNLGFVVRLLLQHLYMAADKSLVRPGRKQVTATKVFDVHISYLESQLEDY
jgi:hypothetical protein